MARRCSSTSGATLGTGRPGSAPCSSSRAAAYARSSPARIAPASAAARPGVNRRRDTPRGGAGSRTTPPPAVEPGEGCRSAKRSPGAAAISASSRRIASVEPSGRSIASRGPRTTRAPGLGRAEMQPEAVAIRRRRGWAAGGGETRGRPDRDEQPRRRDDRGVGGQDPPALGERVVERAEQQRRPAAVGRLDPRPADLDLADPDLRRRRARAAGSTRSRPGRRAGCR